MNAKRIRAFNAWRTVIAREGRELASIQKTPLPEKLLKALAWNTAFLIVNVNNLP